MFSKTKRNIMEKEVLAMDEMLKNLGILIEERTGHLFYGDEFRPLELKFDLVFVRHGKTYGNCGQSNEKGEIDFDLARLNIENSNNRIFQGYVDTSINQLTSEGIKQAEGAAKKLEEDFLRNGWIPDIVFTSPLNRAIDTAKPFIENNQFHDRCMVLEELREMAFGDWDNRRVCDFLADDDCHLFYREQHALIKSKSSPHAENFCEVMMRAYKALLDINEKHAGKKIIMFSHSMFGAACCILLGKGQKIENGDYLAFDGKREDGTYYTMPNAVPFHLTDGLNLQLEVAHTKLNF